MSFRLVIEPVWDWNIQKNQTSYLGDFLVIEPVWDWNINDIKEWSLCFSLVIEPVWDCYKRNLGAKQIGQSIKMYIDEVAAQRLIKHHFK